MRKWQMLNETIHKECGYFLNKMINTMWIAFVINSWTGSILDFRDLQVLVFYIHIIMYLEMILMSKQYVYFNIHYLEHEGGFIQYFYFRYGFFQLWSHLDIKKYSLGEFWIFGLRMLTLEMLLINVKSYS